MGINDGSLTEQDGRLYRFLQATVHLTQTRFRGCAEVVWSATLAPTEETPFSEYDVIKLMKYYIGLQVRPASTNAVQRIHTSHICLLVCLSICLFAPP